MAKDKAVEFTKVTPGIALSADEANALKGEILAFFAGTFEKFKDQNLHFDLKNKLLKKRWSAVWFKVVNVTDDKIAVELQKLA
jgi:hypothetical protein